MIRVAELDVRSYKLNYISRIHVLFICGRNQKRNPTAQKLYQSDKRLSVRSVGTSDSSKRKIQQTDLVWADLALVMEQKYEARIKSRFSDFKSFPKFHSLEIPDEYEYMNEELIELLTSTTEEAINAYQTEQGAAANP